MCNQKDSQTYLIIGAAMAVHQELGHGFLEAVYHEALELEFRSKRIPFKHEIEIPLFYKGHPLKKSYRADFLCFDEIIVEIKALPQISGIDKAQVINYLKATNHERGLLFNFGSSSLQYKRFANTWKKSVKSAKSLITS